MNSYNACLPTVYRTLAFLLQQGLIHCCIARLNVYYGRDHPQQPHTGRFLSDRSRCSKIIITQIVASARFVVSNEEKKETIFHNGHEHGSTIHYLLVVEIVSRCIYCQATADV